MNLINNSLINHIIFTLDKSGSMSGLSQDVIRVFNSQIKHLAKRSQELDQETRVSVYLFDTSVSCIVYDKDVMRVPDISSAYTTGGGTSLIDGTFKSIEDLKKTAQLYGDHSFLVYVLTDGEERDSRTPAVQLAENIKNLPENWTVAVLVPNILGVNEAKRFGFNPNNIMQWSTTSQGIEEVNKTVTAVTEQYMQNRTRGIRGSTSLFTVNTSNIASRKVSDNLDGLANDQYIIVDVLQDSVIKPFVESITNRSYVKGSAYYQLTKKEEIQPYKQICIQNKISKRVYTGSEARDLLGLPNQTVNVKPDEGASKFNIYVQSTSLNRKLIAGTQLLILN